jgi:electron transport complex protein RnfA
MILFKEFLVDMISMTFIAIFLENSIFTRALGTSSSLLLIRKRFSVLIFGISLTVITTLSSIVAYFVSPSLARLDLKYNIFPLAYVTIIGLIYIILLIFGSSIFKNFNNKIKPMIHLSTFNCAVLGALLLSTQDKNSLGGFIGFGLGTGIGFLLATYFISFSYAHLTSTKIPKSFRGFPITLIYIGIISLGFYGLIGHQLPF